MSLIVVMIVSFPARRSFRAKGAHHIVDDAIGPLMALSGKVQIDHGRVQTAVSQILLNPSDVNAGFQ